MARFAVKQIFRMRQGHKAPARHKVKCPMFRRKSIAKPA
jgi:hypothetical protein